jgi:hypothetical protein
VRPVLPRGAPGVGGRRSELEHAAGVCAARRSLPFESRNTVSAPVVRSVRRRPRPGRSPRVVRHPRCRGNFGGGCGSARVRSARCPRDKANWTDATTMPGALACVGAHRAARRPQPVRERRRTRVCRWSRARSSRPLQRLSPSRADGHGSWHVDVVSLQGSAALRSRALSLAHGGALPLESEAVLNSACVGAGRSVFARLCASHLVRRARWPRQAADGDARSGADHA